MLKQIFSLFKRKKSFTKNKKLNKQSKKLDNKLTVSQIMTRNIFHLYPNQTLYEAYRLFFERNISGAPVLEKNRLVGELSKTDILRLLGKKDLIELKDKDFEILKKRKVEEFMKKPICILENSTLDAAKRKMEKYKIRRLLVVNKRGKLVGIITLTDLIRGVSKEEIREKIYTKIDDMLKLLERKEMSVKELATKLSISESIVEEWAKILEEKGLVEIRYRPLSSPIVKLKPKIE